MSKANLADGWCPEQDRRGADCVRLFAPCCSQPFQKKNWTRFSSIFYILVTYRATNWEVILDSGCGQKISNWWEKNFRARAYAEHANRYLFYVLCTTLGERGLLRRSEKGKKKDLLAAPDYLDCLNAWPLLPDSCLHLWPWHSPPIYWASQLASWCIQRNIRCRSLVLVFTFPCQAWTEA